MMKMNNNNINDMDNLNYEHVFNILVNDTKKYILHNNLKSMVLGVSGGIDSTVVAAICNEVSQQTGIPLIGRSLPIKNKKDEFNVSKLVGEAFCDDFKVVSMTHPYNEVLQHIVMMEEGSEKMIKDHNVEQTPIANGNIQARLRMIYLYNLSCLYKGIVMSTDNKTEYELGFFTLHGDVGDFDPIQELWKTEIYGLAKWLYNKYITKFSIAVANDARDDIRKYAAMIDAMRQSIELTPTDGLDISNSDLEQIGAKSYDEVDDILSMYIPFKEYRRSYGVPLHFDAEMAEHDCWTQLCDRYGKEVVDKVWNRHLASEFKRKQAPVHIKRQRYV